MLWKSRAKSALKGRCTFMQIILLLAMVFLAFSNGQATVLGGKSIIPVEADIPDAPHFRQAKAGFY